MSGAAKTNDTLLRYIDLWLREGGELEGRFGTKRSLTAIQFDNVVAKLKSFGFRTLGTGEYHLNIQNEFQDRKSGHRKISNIRTEIHGLHNIQEYCRKNTFDLESPPAWIKFVQKRRKMQNDTFLNPIDYQDFNFRVNYKEEKDIGRNSGIIKNMLLGWKEARKVFRLIKRFTFIKDDVPLQIDCSIVRSSKQKGNYMIPEYRIESSNVFNNKEVYEIEIELLRSGFPTASSWI